MASNPDQIIKMNLILETQQFEARSKVATQLINDLKTDLFTLAEIVKKSGVPINDLGEKLSKTFKNRQDEIKNLIAALKEYEQYQKELAAFNKSGSVGAPGGNAPTFDPSRYKLDMSQIQDFQAQVENLGKTYNMMGLDAQEFSKMYSTNISSVIEETLRASQAQGSLRDSWADTKTDAIQVGNAYQELSTHVRQVKDSLLDVIEAQEIDISSSEEMQRLQTSALTAYTKNLLDPLREKKLKTGAYDPQELNQAKQDIIDYKETLSEAAKSIKEDWADISKAQTASIKLAEGFNVTQSKLLFPKTAKDNALEYSQVLNTVKQDLLSLVDPLLAVQRDTDALSLAQKAATERYKVERLKPFLDSSGNVLPGKVGVESYQEAMVAVDKYSKLVSVAASSIKKDWQEVSREEVKVNKEAKSQKEQDDKREEYRIAAYQKTWQAKLKTWRTAGGLTEVQPPTEWGIDKTTTQLREATEESKNLGGAFNSLGGIARLVFGSILGISVIGAIKSFINWMGQGIDQAIEFNKSMYLFEIGIRALQKTGFDTTIASWTEKMDEFKSQFPMFSQQEIVGAFSVSILKLREYGATQEQINRILAISATLAVAYGRDFQEMANSVTGAITRGYFESLQSMGIAIGRINIMQAALKEGLTGGMMALTEQERFKLAFKILDDNVVMLEEDMSDLGIAGEAAFIRIRQATAEATDAQREMGESLVDLKVKFMELKTEAITFLSEMPTYIAQLSVLLDAVGSSFEAFMDGLRASMTSFAGFFPGLVDAINKATEAWDLAAPKARVLSLNISVDSGKGVELAVDNLSASLKNLDTASEAGKQALQEIMDMLPRLIASSKDPINFLQKVSLALAEGLSNGDIVEFLRIYNELFRQFGEEARKAAKELGLLGDIVRSFEDFGLRHPTLEFMIAPKLDEATMTEILRDIKSKFEELGKALQDALDAAQFKQANANVATWQKYWNTLADLARDYANRVADLQRSLTADLARMDRDYRRNEKRAQQDHLRDMKKLRDDYLNNLEGALRERDALQVIRLTREYDTEKKYREEQYQLEKQRRKEDYEEQRRERIQQYEEQMAEAARQYAERLAEAQKQRDEELDAIKAEYEKEKAEAQKKFDDDVEAYAQYLIDKYDLSAANLKQIDELIKAAYAPGSPMDTYWTTFMEKLRVARENATRSAASIVAALTRMMVALLTMLGISRAVGAAGGTRPIPPSSTRHARGGRVERDEIAIVGEEGPELFVPEVPGEIIPADLTRQLFGRRTTIGWDVAGQPDLSASVNNSSVSDYNMNVSGGARDKVDILIQLSPDLEGRIMHNTLGEAASIIFDVMRNA
jgi:hypothetical protein